MDPLTALGLAGNVVQFVQFASSLIQTAAEIRQSSTGCTTNVLTLDTIYGKLGDLSIDLASKLQNVSGRNDEHYNGPVESIAAFRTLALLCRSDCDKLLEVVSKLKTQDGCRGRWQCFRIAMRKVLKEDEIADLEKRLSQIQVAMTLHICTIASQAHEARLRRLDRLQTESNRLQLDHTAKLDQIASALDNIKRHLEQAQSQPAPKIFSAGEIESLEKQICQLSLSQEAVAEEQAILNSLSFKSRPLRHTSIPVAHQRTFGWVFTPESTVPRSATHFTSWIMSTEGLFWVSGKPGAGKSTFMKFVANTPTTRRLLSKWSHPKRLVIASHFFWSAGTAMQKSQHGLLQTLLYEIFRQCPDLITPTCGTRRPEAGEEDDGGLLPWTLSDLHAALQKVATQDTSSVRFCFLIDGLDEYEGDYYELCRLLKDMAKSSNIKMYLSSRPWNVFEEAFGTKIQNKLYIHDLTRGDILAYTRSRLYEHPRWPSLAAKASQGDSLIEEIEKRASGVFLWVFLVTKLLREGLTNRDSFSDIWRRLESIPVELEVFFRQILESVEAFYHNKMSTTFQMAITASEPLPASAYDFHDQEYDDEDYVLRLSKLAYTKDEEAEIVERMAWRLNSRSRGLLDVNRDSGTVTFLHRTVRDFLNTQSMSKFLAEKAPSGFNIFFTLLKVYTALIKRTKFLRSEYRYLEENRSEGRLTFYIETAFDYAAEVENIISLQIPTYKILEELDRTITESMAQSTLKITNQSNQSPLREYLITWEHVGFLRWKLPRDPTYFSGFGNLLVPFILSDGDCHPALTKPWRNRGVEMLRCVLETQDLNPNELIESHRSSLVKTPWSLLIKLMTSWSNRARWDADQRFWSLHKNDVLRILLRKGANPNAIVRIRTSSNPPGIEGWSAFVAYLVLAFEIAPDTNREALYLEVLREFLRAGAILDLAPITPRFFTVGKTAMVDRLPMASTTDRFFGRISSMSAALLQVCNMRLLGEVAHMLLSNMAECTEPVRTVVERAFPPVIFDRRKTQHPAGSGTWSIGGRKRGASTELEEDLAKMLRTSSQGRSKTSGQI